MKKLWNWNRRKELKRISLPTIQRKIKETFIKVKALSCQAIVYMLKKKKLRVINHNKMKFNNFNIKTVKKEVIKRIRRRMNHLQLLNLLKTGGRKTIKIVKENCHLILIDNLLHRNQSILNKILKVAAIHLQIRK